MIEAVKIWNEPNNKSHWDPLLDPEWDRFAEMAVLAGQAIAAENPGLTRVLGGLSPIDPYFINRLTAKGVLEAVDVVAVHGFPLDWNLWQINEWPEKLEEFRKGTHKPIWVTEVGVSSFGAEEVQAWGLKRTAELLIGRAPRIHWYSLYDLPQMWEATTRHKEAEGSSYYRHFHKGLLREDGTHKRALEVYADYAAEMGLCQWFHYEVTGASVMGAVFAVASGAGGVTTVAPEAVALGMRVAFAAAATLVAVALVVALGSLVLSRFPRRCKA